MENILNPSILSANFVNLESDLLELERNNIKKFILMLWMVILFLI